MTSFPFIYFQLLVLLTDGKQTQDDRTPEFINAGDNAEPLKRDRNVTIYAIGIGSADPVELGEIASGFRQAIPATFDNLLGVVDVIVREYCKGKTLTNWFSYNRDTNN